MYDVVIIGSGLGGLLSGAILSKEGLNVCVLEKHSQIGGCLQTFTRDGCIFDTGVHYISSLDQGQILNRYFSYLGLMEKLNVERMDPDGYDRIWFASDRTEYRLGMGEENFKAILSEAFPHQRKALDTYVSVLAGICNEFDLYNLRAGDSRYFTKPYLFENAHAWLASVTDDVKLQNVLAGMNLLYAGNPVRTPLYVHALIAYSYMQSAYRLVDGSSQIARILADIIQGNGGTVLRKREVTNLLFRDGKVHAVVCANGEQYESRQVIANIHPSRLIHIAPQGTLRRSYVERVDNLTNTISAFNVYLTFKDNTFPYLKHNYYLHPRVNVWDGATAAGDDWPAGVFCFTPSSSRSDVHAESMAIMTYMKYDEVRQWENSTVEKRGEGYREFKHRRTEKVIDAIEARFPDIRSHILSAGAATPLTYRDYTGTKHGALYGIERTCDEPFMAFVSHKTPVPNLYLTGQNINMHGVLGVTIGSVVTCSAILGLEYLVQRIAKT